MQTKKFLSVIGLGAMFVAFTLTSGARDTETQIKAREALRQKMAELNAPPPTAPKPAAPEPPPAPAKPAEPAAPAPPPARPQAVVPAAALTPAVAIPSSTIFEPVPEAVEDAKTSRAREALRQEMAALQNTPGVAAKPTRHGRAASYTAPVVSTPLVMEAPLPPLSGSKTARLAELLQRYNADQITPKEYHTQRAAILAEP